MPKKTQQLFAFVFGVVFVIVLLVLAIKFPDPTPFQYEVFKVVLALAAAGVAVMIPGFLQVEVSTWLRAGGAMAVFAVVYFNTPARLLVSDPEPNPTALFPIVLSCQSPEGVRLNTFSFPLSDIKKNAEYDKFRALVAQLPGQQCDQASSKIFRMKDELQLMENSNLTATDKSNLGAIVLPSDVIVALGDDDHLAFSKIHSQFQARSLIEN